MGVGRLIIVCNYPLSYTCGNPSRKGYHSMSNKETRFTVCLQSIIFSMSRFTVNGITFRVHVL